MEGPLDDTRPPHPVLAFLDVVDRGLRELVDAPMWSLDVAGSTLAVTRLAATAARLAELEARVLRQAEEVDAPGEMGTRSLSAWLSRVTRLSRPEAGRRVRLAHALAAREQTRDAMARGEVHAEQALVIDTAVSRVSEQTPIVRQEAEAHLVAQASEFDAKALERLGQRVLEVVDPEAADEHEARLLEAQEARARRRTALRMWDDGEGLTHGRFTIPVAQGSMLRKALLGLAAPKHVRATAGAGSYEHEVPTPARMGQAFSEYVERFPLDRLPRLGGVAATVVATVDVATLQGAAKAAQLDTGVAVSPGQLRRWACEAGVMPAVLGSASHVLDLGRKVRLHTQPQRIALIVEQGGCQHPGCDVLGALCHVHHVIAWDEGGPTSTRRAVLLCPFHHHLVHAQGTAYPMLM